MTAMHAKPDLFAGGDADHATVPVRVQVLAATLIEAAHDVDGALEALAAALARREVAADRLLHQDFIGPGFYTPGPVANAMAAAGVGEWVSLADAGMPDTWCPLLAADRAHLEALLGSPVRIVGGAG